MRCVFSQSLILTPEVPPSDVSAWRAVVRVLRSPLAEALDSLCSVLFPADCRVCGSHLSGFSLLPVCSSCWNDLPTQSNALCARCGETLSFDPAQTGEPLCRPCRVQPPDFERAVAHGAYRGTLRSLLHLLKYDGIEALGKPLGHLLAAQLAGIPELPPDLLVIPVPLFRGKRRERGFNQAERLAGAMITALRRHPCGLRLRLASGLLERRRATESQAGLSPHQRRMNVRGAFLVPRPGTVAGKNILLIDDIYTTGATARACSAALRRAGAAKIWVATVARAQKEFAILPELPPPLEEATTELPMEEDFAYWEDSRVASAGGTAS